MVVAPTTGSESPYGSLAGGPLRQPLAYRPDADRQPPWSVPTTWLLCLPPGANHREGCWPATRMKTVCMAVGLPPGRGSLASRRVYTPHGYWPTTRCSTPGGSWASYHKDQSQL